MFQMKFLIKNLPSAGPSNNCILAFPVTSPCFYQSTLQFYDEIRIYIYGAGANVLGLCWLERKPCEFPFNNVLGQIDDIPVELS